jgi:hypothetical protein
MQAPGCGFQMIDCGIDAGLVRGHLGNGAIERVIGWAQAATFLHAAHAITRPVMLD